MASNLSTLIAAVWPSIYNLFTQKFAKVTSCKLERNCSNQPVSTIKRNGHCTSKPISKYCIRTRSIDTGISSAVVPTFCNYFTVRIYAKMNLLFANHLTRLLSRPLTHCFFKKAPIDSSIYLQLSRVQCPNTKPIHQFDVMMCSEYQLFIYCSLSGLRGLHVHLCSL